MQKVLVTGGAGFIGSNLIKRLLEEGHEVHSIDNYDSGTPDNEVPGCIYHVGDIEHIGMMDDDFDICFHLAALSRIQPSFENPTETFRVNARGTEAVCEWARAHGVKVVYAGSSSRWHDPTQSPYAMYKYLGEEICKLYRKTYKMQIEIARFYNVYGPNEIVDGDWAAVIGIWRRQVRDGERITIVGDGEQRRDFTHVVDIVDGLYRIALSSESHHDAWELGTGVNYSINELYKMFKSRFDIECTYIADQPGNYRETLCENYDTSQRLGWQPGDRLQSYINTLDI
jgi:UDP-glucose 4-epimerase